jgi:hypothetical protein
MLPAVVSSKLLPVLSPREAAMPAYARREIVREGEVGVYHCMARCVRRAFLCGQDALTGRSFEHRKGWIRRRLEELAGIFAIDVCSYAVMGNHLHVIVRTRPDVTAVWSDAEVAARWWRLFPRRRDEQGLPAEPEPHELAMLVADPGAAGERRRRLGSLSWLMRCLCEPIARRANREDDCTGRFWEGRFKSQALLDDSAVLACSVYVDLNPIRAGAAERPEECEYTSAYDRIVALRARRRGERSVRRRKRVKGHKVRSHGIARDGWLCPIDAERPSSRAGAGAGRSLQSTAGGSPAGEAASRRASSQAFLSLSVEDYLRLLDWTGRQVRCDKRGAIPGRLSPILERLQVAGETWVASVENFGRWFHRAVGRADRLCAEAARRGKRWFQGLAPSRAAFR